jgi:parallel beta-helix repeat protein
MKITYTCIKKLIVIVLFFLSFNIGFGQTVQLGSGATVTGSSASSPINIWYRSNHCQIVYTASELNAVGAYGGYLGSIGFYISSAPIYNLPGFTIKMKHTLATDADLHDNGTFQTVYYNSSYLPQAGGFDVLNLDSLFLWNGIDNIVVDVCFSQVPAYNQSGTVRYYSTTNGYIYNWSDNSNMCPANTSSVTTYKPQCMMEFIGGLGNNDAGIVNIFTTSTFCAGTSPISSKIINFGTNILDTVIVNWSINNTLQPPIYHTAPLDTFGGIGSPDTTLFLGNYNFQFGQVYDIQAWTSMPNGVIDTVNVNDTASITISPGLQGTYTIGGANSDYSTIDSAVTALENYGICGAVTFNIRNGLYNTEQIVINEIVGTDSLNTITFQSESGDSSLVTLSYSANNINNYTFLLDGADWIRLKNMTIEATNATYTRVVVLQNGANHNMISNCYLKGYNTTSTSTNFAVIYSNGFLDEYNQFLNNRIEFGSYGIYLYGVNTSSLEKGTVISGNQFLEQYYTGVRLYYQDAPQIHNNEIRLKSQYSSTLGIYLRYCDNDLVISNNQIIGVKGNGIYLYYCDGTTINRGLTANNFIYTDGTANNSSVYFNRSYYQDFHNNTIRNISSGNSSYAFQNYVSYYNSLKNNIFYSENSYAFYTNSPSYISEIDYNNYYTNNGQYIAYWNGDRATLADLQTASGKDTASLSENSYFLSDSTYQVGQISLNGAGIPTLGITTDIDGELRDTLNPDIGADEFIPPAEDAGIIAVNPPIAPFSSGNQPITAILKNYGNNFLTTVTIEWSVNDTTQTSVNWTGNLASGDTTIVQLGNMNFGVGVGYDLKAWTMLPNGVPDIVTINDTTESLDNYAALSGVYTIGGTSPDFVDFTTATFALNQGGVIGQTTFNVRDGNYNEQVVINEVVGADSINHVVFQSESGDSSLVTISYSANSSDNYTLLLDGADWIRFKNMTIEATNASYARVVVLQNGADHNIVSNCYLKGYSTTNTNDRYTVIYSPSNEKEEYNQFLNNRVEFGSIGIYLYGVNTSSLEKGTVISGNQFLEQYYNGVRLYYQDAPQIHNNEIRLKSQYSNTLGIDLYYCDNELVISNNQIIGVKGNGIYLYYCDGTTINRGLTTNNFIYTDGTANNSSVYFNRSYYQDFHNNTIRNISSGNSSYAFQNYVSYYNSLKNNILYCENGYAFYTNSSSYINEIDYNNYYTNNGQNIAYWNGDRATFADFQTASGKDTASLSENPYFLSDSTYQVGQISLNGAGTTIAGITTDIEGEVRDTLNPDIGADEFNLPSTDAGAISIIIPVQPFAQGDYEIYAQIRNFGNDTLTSATIEWEINNTVQTSVGWTGNLISGDSINVLLDTINFVINQPYDFKAWTTNPNNGTDNITVNDTTNINDIYAALGGVYTIGGITPDFDNFTEATNALNFGGVVSSVIFNVRDTIFNEQIVINEILGVDSLNNITFQSENGDSSLAGLKFNNPNSTFNYIVKIDGADWITFKGLSFEALNANYYGYARIIEITNGANHLNFENNYFKGFSGAGYSGYERSLIYLYDNILSEYFSIKNNHFEEGFYGLSLYGNYNSNQAAKGFVIENNTFNNQYYQGINAHYLNGAICNNNLIVGSNLNTGYDGISLNYFRNGVEIINNRLRNIQNNGIYLYGISGTITNYGLVANNFIHTEGTGTSYGIYVYDGTYLKVYHNNLNVKSTNTGSQAIYNRYGSNKYIVNNNFINQGGGYAVYYQSIPTESNYNNLFTTGTNIGYLNGNQATLADWKLTNLDTNSISVDPQYVDSIDLHVNNVLLDKVGKPVAEVTTDIDGNGRDPIRPDIGADEFSSDANDAGIATVYAPQKPFEATSHPIYAKLLNNGLDTLRNVDIGWAVNGIVQTPYTWSDSLITGSFNDSLNIGNFIFEEDTLYNIVAWTSQPNFTIDADSLNDTASVHNIYAALSGYYTIGGTTPDYQDFQEAVTALQYGGVADSVIFNVRNGTYTEQVSIPEIVGASASHHITFQSESGDSSQVIWTYASTLSNDNYTLRLDGADYFRFKGLTIKATGTTYATAVDIRNSANYNTFENNEFSGIATTSSNTRYAIMYSPDNNVLDEYNIVQNNYFKRGGTGIFFYGNGTTSLENGTLIKHNRFDSIGRAAIYLYYQDAPIIDGNIISTHYVNGSYMGIDTRYCDNEMKITNNTIVDIDRGRGIYIERTDGMANQRALIANNIINIKGNSTARGLELAYCSYADVYHNNILITSTNTGQNALYTYNNNGNIRVKNNIFANTGGGYAIYTNSTNDITSTDYNDLYATGTNLTRWNGTIQTDLTAWQTASGFGTNSISIDPLFTSVTDLHVEEVDLNNAGTPLAAVTTDIDGEQRNATTPDIGADEFTPIALNDVGIIAIISPNAATPFAAGNQDIYVTIKNNGSDTISTATINWAVNNNLGAPYAWSGNLLPGERDTVNIGVQNFGIGIGHDILAYTQNPNGSTDSTTYNDSTLVTDLYAGLAGVYTIGGLFPDFNTFNDAVNALNNGGILDSVTFNVRNGIYNEQFIINEIRGTSINKQVVFQSESGDSSLVTLSRSNSSGNNYIFRLIGADYLTFKDLTFQTINSYYTHIATIQNATNIKFLNNYFTASNTAYDLIYTSSSSNVIIKNNHFENGYEALDINGSGLQIGTIIQNNVFENQSYRAIDLNNQDAPQIINNTITSNTNSSAYEAMYLQYCDNALKVTKNKIFGISAGGIYLRYCDGTTTNNSLIANNFIQIEGTIGETGIYLDQGSYMNVYHNSVSITNINPNSQAIYNYYGNNKNIVNNIFANSGGGYAAKFYSSGIASLDYNDYYTTGTNLGRWNNTDITTFASWKSTSGKDAQSFNVNPLFVSNTTNLHITQVALDSMATTLIAVTDDIDGDIRNTGHPDIGADEFDYIPDDVGIVAVNAPSNNCDLTSTEQITILIQNYGSSAQTGFNVAYQLDNNTAIVENIGGLVVPAGDTASFTFSGTVDFSTDGDYDITAYTLASDYNINNDTFNTTVTHIETPSLITSMLPADGTGGFSQSIPLSWSPSSGATLYDLYIWIDTLGSVMPTTSTVSNISQISYTYSSNSLVYGATYKWAIVAKNNSCETQSGVQTFILRSLPDVIVSNIVTPSTAFSSQQITLNWDITNNGTGATNTSWTDAIYLSNDAVFDGTDTYLGGIASFSALNPNGDSYTNTATFTLPQGISGNYRIFVITDRYNNLIESDNNNNTAVSSPIAISLTPPPDLQVTNILIPNNAFSGTNVNIQYTVTNEGTGTTLENYWRDRIYLSTDSTLNTGNAHYLGQFNRNSVLAVDSSYTNTLVANLPANIFDTFFVYVVTDYYNHVYEHANELNNTERSTPLNIILTPPPDLTVTGITLPDTASNGQNVSISWTVFNQGGTAPLSSWRDRVILSPIPNDVNFTNAITLGNYYRMNNLNPGDSYTNTQTITIPSNWNGAAYLHVITDVYDNIFEYTNENNNSLESSDSIVILNADLTVANINAPITASSGDTISIDWNNLNIGNGDVLNIGWGTRVLLSTSSTFDPNNVTLLATVNDNSLPSSDTSSHQVSVVLPNGISGQYYIYVETDYNTDIYETNENNNVNTLGISLAINLAPWIDLTPTMLQPQSTTNAGNALSVNYTIKNDGTTTAQGLSWQDKIYLSSNSTWNPSTAQLLKTTIESGTLGVDSTYNVQTTVTIPINTPTGTYYLHLLTDEGNTVYEYTFENNNRIGSIGFSVVGYPPVDLAVTNVIASTNAMSGGTAQIQWEVQNLSNHPTIVPNWNDAVYLSTDTIWNPNSDVLVNSWQQFGSLDSNATYLNSQNIAIPNGLSGQYYFIVVTDYNYLNNDYDLSNNYYVVADSLGNSTPIVVVLTPPADLVVNNLDAPSQGTAGQPVQIIYTVTNNGTGPTLSGSWIEKFYLSTDFILSGGDQQVASLTHNGNLNIGESYTDTVQVFLPINISGNRILIIKTDNNNSEYEHTNENNNTSTSPITIVQPPPSDLVVTMITVPDSAIAGESITINWTKENTGQNPAIGTMKEAIYLSTDTIWDINDALLGVQTNYINLAPQAQQSQSITADLTGVTLADYYAIVRTDILNNIYESNDTNNTSYSTSTINVNVQELPLHILTLDTLEDNKELCYRIHIPDTLEGETILITLKGDSITGANELYLRHGDIPSRAVYDFKHSTAYAGNQEVIIPSVVQGDYYLMAYGNTLSGNTQPITLYAEILNFEIRSINANTGGNTGTVTVQVNGAKFDSTTVILLATATDTIYAQSVAFESSIRLYPTFNLEGKTIGVYDVLAKKQTGEIVGLDSAFNIVQGTASNLVTNVLRPTNTRANRVITLRLEYTNAGNTDIVNPIVILKSAGGAPLGYVPERLSDGITELTILLQEPGNSSNRLRPGASGTVLIYTKSSSALGFTLIIPNN